MERMLVDTATMDWQNGLDVVRAMAQEFRDGLGPADQVERVYAKYRQKTLYLEPETTRRGDLIRLDAGYRDLTNAYHDSVEECLVLDGEFDLDGEGHFRAWDYFWRPPGWVHAAETAGGFTALLMLEGAREGEGSGPVSRRIRPDDEAGTNALHDDPERAVGPRGWVRRLETGLVAWVPGPVFARGQGSLEDFGLERAAFKRLSANPWTGGQSLLVRLEPGYTQRVPGSHATTWMVYVLDGACRLGDLPLGAGSFLYRPAGVVEQPLASDDGALLFVKADGWLDFAAA